MSSTGGRPLRFGCVHSCATKRRGERDTVPGVTNRRSPQHERQAAHQRTSTARSVRSNRVRRSTRSCTHHVEMPSNAARSSHACKPGQRKHLGHTRFNGSSQAHSSSVKTSSSSRGTAWGSGRSRLVTAPDAHADSPRPDPAVPPGIPSECPTGDQRGTRSSTAPFLLAPTDDRRTPWSTRHPQPANRSPVRSSSVSRAGNGRSRHHLGLRAEADPWPPIAHGVHHDRLRGLRDHRQITSARRFREVRSSCCRSPIQLRRPRQPGLPTGHCSSSNGSRVSSSAISGAMTFLSGTRDGKQLIGTGMNVGRTKPDLTTVDSVLERSSARQLPDDRRRGALE